ncbi:hypothetical protein BYT27DRAFT_6470061 [Phlegmacium glaucopus]|nr:hypothetical protein BYT27DRAFT_6470061 [Phlegmacium glaucopus]
MVIWYTSTFLARTSLILGSQKRANDLLEKRSLNYSDRMRMPMLIELKSGVPTRPFCGYGVWWRKYRKSFPGHFHASAVSKYLPGQRREVHALLRRLFDTPDDFLYHIRQSKQHGH